jgi:poly-gamma-glutamate synthesis protein (capsule biosynthesis protein)
VVSYFGVLRYFKTVKMLLRYVVLFLPLFGSCGKTDTIRIDYQGSADREQSFLRGALSAGALEGLGLVETVDPADPKDPKDPEGSPLDSLRRVHTPAPWGGVVDFQWFFTWDKEDPEAGDGLFPLSRTWYVPRGDPLDGRTGISLEDCLSGGADLVPLKELRPPYTALRVDGLAVDDPGYPLVKFTGARITINGNERSQRRLEKKVSALQDHVLKSLEAAPELFEETPALFYLAAGGDVMLGRGAGEILRKEGPSGIFGGSAALLAKADCALVNLEGPISGRGEKVRKDYNFRFDHAAAAGLYGAGIDAVLLANNPAFDYGAAAFLDTLALLADAGIGVLGAGLNAEAAARPFLLRRPGGEVRIFGVASFPRERIGWDVLAAAAGPDKPGILHTGGGGQELLKPWFTPDDPAEAAGPDAGNRKTDASILDIVLFHGGQEWSFRPDGATRQLYTDLIRAGADLIIGSHPHVVQGFEWIGEKAVFWSLGNYVFGGMEHTGGGEEGLLISLGYLGTRLIYLEPHALILSHNRTDLGKMENLSRFYALSRELRDRREQR